MKMEQIERLETSAQKIQTSGNHPKERIQVLVLLMTHVFRDLLLFCVILEKIVDLSSGFDIFSNWRFRLKKSSRNLPFLISLHGVISHETYSSEMHDITTLQSKLTHEVSLKITISRCLILLSVGTSPN